MSIRRIELLERRTLNAVTSIELPQSVEAFTARDFCYAFDLIASFTVTTPTGFVRYAGRTDTVTFNAIPYDFPFTGPLPQGYVYDDYFSSIAQFPLMYDRNNAGIGGPADVPLFTPGLELSTHLNAMVADFYGEGVTHEHLGTVDGHYLSPSPDDPYRLDFIKARAGDVNHDGLFGTDDLIQLMAEGTYESSRVTDFWGGDFFGGDRRFDSQDLVYALQFGYDA